MKKVITAMLAATLMLSAVSVMKMNVSAKDLIITLDPGHGEGKSADGSTGSGTAAAEVFGGKNELYYNLDISLYTRERLEQYAGVEVYMTREVNNYTPGLQERVDIAKSHNSDAIISIHNNMNPNPNAYGSQIYIPNDNYRPDMAKASKNCANAIMKRLNDDAGTHKNADPYTDSNTDAKYPDGSKADRLRVIRFAKADGLDVAMIVECAFLSNKNDYEKHIATDEGLKKLGYAIADGLADHYKLTLKTVQTEPETTVPETEPITTVPETTLPETEPITTATEETVPETVEETAAKDTEKVTEEQTEAATESQVECSEATADDEEKEGNKAWLIPVIGVAILAVAATVFFIVKSKIS